MSKEMTSNDNEDGKNSNQGTMEDWRKAFYKYAAVGFNSPKEPLLSELESGLFFEGMKRFSRDLGLEDGAIEELADSFAEEDPDDYLTTLQAEYVSLFVSDLGGPRVHPYESMHVDGKLQSSTTREVAKLYSSSGLVKNEDYEDLPDHVAAELEFLHKLSEVEGEGALKASYNFLTAHLLRWFPTFADRVRKETDLLFFKVLSKWVELGLNEDKKFLEEELDDGC